MDVRRDSTETSAIETVTVVPQSVTEERENVLEIARLAGLENVVTKHAVKILKTNVTETLAVALRAVYPVTLGIFVTKRAMIDVYLVVIRELTTVSIDFYLKRGNNAIFKTYIIIFIFRCLM